MSIVVKDVKVDGDSFVVTVEITKTFAELMQDQELRSAVASSNKKPGPVKKKWFSELTGKNYASKDSLAHAEKRFKDKARGIKQPANKPDDSITEDYVALRRKQKLMEKMQKLQEQIDD